MKPETEEWLQKAEGDLDVAQREIAYSDPVWHVICFLSQQSAEKHLKALLEERGTPFPKTHDLVVLLDLTEEPRSRTEPIRTRLAHLGAFGIAARYPGSHAYRAVAEEAVATAREVRDVVRSLLGLS